MTRIMIAMLATAFMIGVAGLAATQSVAAQPGGPPVCLSLAPGEHEISAPAQDREGEVIFRVTVADGGVVTEFVEPGGQSIPPVALIDIFTGADAYPLPDGVAIVECEAGDSMMEDEAAGELCLNLEPGSYEESVSAGGQTYNITINVGEGNRLTSVEVLGTSYAPADALDLLEQFGAAIPPHIQILPCEPAATGTGLPYTGSGGLADSGSLGGLWAGLATLTVLAVAIAAAVQGRRVVVRNRRDR